MSDKITIDLDIDSSNAEKEVDSFKKESKKAGSDAGKNFAKGFGVAIAAIGASFVVLMKKASDAASVQEDAVNRLNQSLVSAGRFTRAASQDMQDFASELQKVTTIGDETTLEMLALANTFARTNEEAKDMVKAAANLSAATGVSLESAIRNLGKSFSGLTGELGESIGEIRTLTAEQLKSGAAVDLVAKKFAGFSESQKNTFSGAKQGVTNALGDILETISRTSPMVIKLLNKVETALVKFNDKLSEAFKDNNFTKALLDNLIFFANGINIVFVKPVEAAVDIVQTGIRAVQTAFFGYITGVSKVASFLVSKFAPESELAQTLQTFSNVTAHAFDDSMGQVKESVDSAFGFETSNKISSFLNTMQAEVDEASKAVGNSFQDMEVKAVTSATVVEDKTKEMGQIIKGSLVNFVSQGISSIATSLVQGGNAFGDFSKTALNILGDFAIQMGTFIIASSKAIEALKASIRAFSAGLGIAAGIALIAVGAALKSFAGGPSAANSAGSEPSLVNPTPVQPVAPIATEPEDSIVENQKKGPSITVNVQGNILDRRQSGLELVEVIRDAFATNDLVIT